MDDDVLKETLQDLYEHAPCGYIFTRPDGALIRVNATFLDWTGFARDEVLSKRFQEMLTVPGRLFYEAQFLPLLLMQGAVQEVAFDVIRANGSGLPVLVNAVTHTDAAGTPVWIASTLFAATDRRAYERELLSARTRAEHLAEVVTASIDAIVTCSVDGDVLNWNGSAERLFGHTHEVFTGVRLADLLSFGSTSEYASVMTTLRRGSPVLIDTVARDARGGTIDVSVSFTPHTDELGNVSSVSAIIRDISERRALERLQQDFLAMASHELRTPLVSIRGHAQLMQRREAYSQHGIGVIIAQTSQLARLIDDLLLVSQIEADRLELHLDLVDLSAVARESAGLVVRTAGSVGVNAPPEQVLVNADKQRLYQVLGNLLSNATKYSPATSEIEIWVRNESGSARVDVVDHGNGIRPDDLPHVFTRFYRASDVMHEVKGTGLGLYITRRIVEAHAGTISATSTYGKGSTFTVSMPLAQPA